MLKFGFHFGKSSSSDKSKKTSDEKKIKNPNFDENNNESQKNIENITEDTTTISSHNDENPENKKYLDKLKAEDIQKFDLNIKNFNNPLHLAILDFDNIKINQILETNDIDINIQDSKDMCTALHIAVQINNTTLTNKLLSIKNIDIDAIDINGRTALIMVKR